MRMNYSDALTLAIDALSASTDEATLKAVEKLTALRTTYQKRADKRYERATGMSAEERAARSATRKAHTAALRAELCKEVMPILREVITTDMTAKEIFAAARDRLPADFSVPKVQNILIREMASELIKTETKGKPNTYRMR